MPYHRRHLRNHNDKSGYNYSSGKFRGHMLFTSYLLCSINHCYLYTPAPLVIVTLITDVTFKLF